MGVLRRLLLTSSATVALLAVAASPVQARWHATNLRDRHHPQEVLNPAVVTNHHGRALVAWTCTNGKQYPYRTIDQLCMRIRKASGRWGPERALSPRAGTAGAVMLAMNRRGEAVAAWSTGGDGSTVIARRVHRDGRLGPLVFFTRGGSAASVAIDDAGTAIVGIDDYMADEGYVSVLRPGRPPTTPADVGPTSLGAGPDVAMNATGDAVVAWGAGYEVDARDVHLDGTLGPTADLSGSTLPSMPDSIEPHLDGQGDLVLTWLDDHDSTNLKVLAVRRPAGGAVGSPQVLTEGDTDVFQSAVDVAPDGAIDIVWTHGIEGTTYVAHASPSGVLSPKTLIGRHAAYVTMTMAPDGSGIATWGRAVAGAVQRLYGYSERISPSGHLAPRRHMPYTYAGPVAHLVDRRFIDAGYDARDRFAALVGP